MTARVCTRCHWGLRRVASDEDATVVHACTDPDGYWIDIETVAEHTEGELGDDHLSIVCGSRQPFGLPFAVREAVWRPRNQLTSGTWYNHPDLASWNPSGLDTSMLAMDPNLAFDSFMTIGSENSDGGPFPFSIWMVATLARISARRRCQWAWAMGPCSCSFLDLMKDTHPALGDDLRVLVMQITTRSTASST